MTFINSIYDCISYWMFNGRTVKSPKQYISLLYSNTFLNILNKVNF